jgi:hypothetical protein
MPPFVGHAPDFIRIRNVRKECETEMWRYDGPACKAFFFLYPYGNSLLVRHVETVPGGQLMAADQTCLDSLRNHMAAPAS